VGRYILIRVLQGIITLLVIATLVFGMARATGDPVMMMIGGQETIDDIQYIRHQLGLDRPLYEQYWNFLKDSVQGDFGNSINDRGAVSDLIKQRLPNSLKLGFVAIVWSTIFGIALGVAAAVKRGTWIDRAVRVLAVLGQSVPAFWLGIVLIFVFGVWIPILPIAGMDSAASYVLPAAVLAFFQLPITMRLMRSSVLETLDTEYIKLARVKGLPEGTIIWKHAVKNALIPVLTSAGMLLAYSISGAVVVETVFNWPGIGRLAYEAMLQRDFPLIQGTVMTVAVIVVFLSLIVDLMYAYLDPRIRYQRGEK